MSHYTVGIIIPDHIIDKEEYIHEALAPYDENKEVPAYWKDDNPTWRARWHVRTVEPYEVPAGATEREKDNIRSEHTEIPEENDPAVQALLNDPEAMLNVLRKQYPEETWRYHEGQYQRRTTYNPKSKWDWYRIGGRWDGDIQEKKDELMTDNGFNFHSPCRIEDNIAAIDELLERDDPYVPFAILTPEGWIGKGDMGWFGAWCADPELDSPEQPEREAYDDEDVWRKDMTAWRKEIDMVWEKKGLEIYRQYPDASIVIVDCHI